MAHGDKHRTIPDPISQEFQCVLLMLAERNRRYWHIKHLLEATRDEHRDRNYYCYGGGRVLVSEISPWVYKAAYSGPVSAECYIALREHTSKVVRNARSVVLDMTAVLDTSVAPIPPKRGLAPGVIICRPDQLKAWQGYAAGMLERGTTRIVFLEAECLDALAMARALAGV